MTAKTIYCCGCEKDVPAKLTNGAEIYPHRKDLARLPFWKCPKCGNYVGCHHKTGSPLTPLGSIPTHGIRKLRQQIHAKLDPMWQTGVFAGTCLKRREIYKIISKRLGADIYHTAEIRTETEARKVLDILDQIEREKAQ